jgi:hypothetical protein
MKTDTITDTPPLKKQNEFSLGDQETKVEKPKFKYMEPCFVEAVAEFLRHESTLTRNAVAQKGDKHFDRYSEELIAIRDTIGPPDKNKQIPADQRTEVLDLIRCSSAAKPLLFLANRLWGLDFKKEALRADSGSQSTVLNQSEIQQEKERGDSSPVALKSFLEKHNADKPLSVNQMEDLIQSLAQGTKQAEAQSRIYIETMLYIGAALIFFRFQCALLDKEEAKALHDRLLVALNLNFRKTTKSALDSTLGRIRRAYLKAMSAYQEIQTPELSDKKTLWNLYKNSLPQIPKLVDRYFSGDLSEKYFNGIPYLPKIPGSESEKKTQSPEWARHVKALRAMFEASDPDSDKDNDFDERYVESTMFSLERLTGILALQDNQTLYSYKVTIEDQIKRLESLLIIEVGSQDKEGPQK